MSQILLGLVGVVIFIGLALAASVLFGDQFRQSTATSRAAAMVQAATQLSHAASLFNLQSGQVLQANDLPAVLVSGNYLAGVPRNPMLSDADFFLRRRSNVGSSGVTGNADIVLTRLGSGGASSLEWRVCRQIELQAGATGSIPDVTAVDVTGVAVRPFGCFRTPSAVAAAGFAANDYYAYARF